MNGHLITVDGQPHDATVDEVRGLLERSEQFWLDLEDPNQADQDAVLRDTFGFHPLAIQGAIEFGQRPKIDNYDDFALLVVFGLNPVGRLVEIHCFYTETYLVTVHKDHCPVLNEVLDRLHQRPPQGRRDHVMVLYRLLDAVVDRYFPLLADMDDRIDELEDEILVRPTEQQLGTLFDLKRQLIALRKVVTPQRDMFAALLSTPDMLPAMTPDAERYFRDLYDHLIRISDLVDSYRDLLSGALDTHLSTVSNRLNVVMKQLTIMATLFLPATFFTGFFGQNFGWMVTRLGSAWIFWGLGVLFQLMLAATLLYYFWRRGWISSDGTGTPNQSLRRPPRPRVRAEHRWQIVHPGGLASTAAGSNAEGAVATTSH
jgi:magnesium transporter